MNESIFLNLGLLEGLGTRQVIAEPRFSCTNTILVDPYYIYRIMGSKTLF